MKTKLMLLFLILLSFNVFAVVDRVIDPEIPISDDFIDFETNFDELLISVFMVVLLVIGSMAGIIITGFGIIFIASKLKWIWFNNR